VPGLLLFLELIVAAASRLGASGKPVRVSTILRRMESLGQRLRMKRWGLPLAREIAAGIFADKSSVRILVRELFGDDVEVRKRAADVARRITEKDARPLEPYADELAGLLETVPVEESRTRWHLGLVVPRIAHTRLQRLRAARTMSLLAQDESNVVRCSAVEGLGLLAIQEASLRDEAEEMIERFLREGTTAMKSRARGVINLWARSERRKACQ
jgi:HEAT repeat protein